MSRTIIGTKRSVFTSLGECHRRVELKDMILRILLMNEIGEDSLPESKTSMNQILSRKYPQLSI